jgi:uracil-DNA glycosylase
MAPYHSLYNKSPIADGLCMSCSITGKLQPSLFQWYNAIENELYNGLCAPCIKNPDLTYLARNRVLLLNAGLTVEINHAGNHNSVWEPFMKYLFENVFDVIRIPIILLGKEAQKIEKYIDPYTKVFKLSHPASASYSGIDWSSEGVFKVVNKIIMDTNGHSIQWMDEFKN